MSTYDVNSISIFMAITSLFSAFAAITSAYVAYKNRQEQKEHRLAEKKERERKEWAEKYRSVILERRLVAIDEFYEECIHSADEMKENLQNEAPVQQSIKSFLSNYSSHMLQFRKNLLSFVRVIDKTLEQSITQILEEYQDHVSQMCESTFSEVDFKYTARIGAANWLRKEMEKSLTKQRADIIRLIVSYVPEQFHNDHIK